MSKTKNFSPDDDLKIDLPPRPWHTLTAGQVSAQFGVDLSSGLSEEAARERLIRFGPNRLTKEKREPIWERFLEEAGEPMIVLLLVTGLLYALWGGWADALAIFSVILTLIGIEVWNEYRAERAIGALQKMAEPIVSLRRDARYKEVPTEEVVPGDLISLKAGRRIPADARLVEGYGLAVDESSLTGESLPVEKIAEAIFPKETALGERSNLIFAGTTVARGRGVAVAVATGVATELGRTALLAREFEPPRTPLQQTMRELTRWMVWLALGFSLMAPLLGGLHSGQPLREMLLTGLSLAFATIPEELPILITLMLALGGYRLSRRRAIVKRLQAVETLGAVTVIATDKTGTLTANRMMVSRIDPEAFRLKALEIGVLCSSLEEGEERINDPLESALLQAARETGLDPDALRRASPLRTEFTFDALRKRMSVVCHRDGGLWVAVKGAPEGLLGRATDHWTKEGKRFLSDAERQTLFETAARMAAEGLRVIAFAEKGLAEGPISQEEAESGLIFVGLAGLADPPRPEAEEAIASCRAAGIRPMMITGDHPLTARAVARRVGLDGEGLLMTGPELDLLSDEALRERVGRISLYARTTPEHKLRIVRALQKNGERVAVTGDGINDAPALSAADIGVAMGKTGTDVARESGDVILADDNFATLVHAIEEGRVLFANLRKAVRYYLAVKVALIGTMLLPALLGVPAPFAPIQIIIMELFMDLAASATFLAEAAEPDLMRRPPRDPKAPFIDRAMVGSLFYSAAGLFAAVSIAYLVARQGDAGPTHARTVAFVTWLLGHFFLALNLRSEREPLLRLGLFSNRPMTAWGAATVAFAMLATSLSVTQGTFKIVPLSTKGWALAVGLALAGTFWMEAMKWFPGDRNGTSID